MKRQYKRPRPWPWNFWRVFCYSGLGWFAIFVAAGYFIKKYFLFHDNKEFVISSWQDVQWIVIISALLWLIVIIKNSMHTWDEKPLGFFTWMRRYTYVPPAVSERRFKAQHPPIPARYLRDQPSGLVLGTDPVTGRYVSYDNPYSPRAVVLLGLPGSGKTSLLQISLLYNYHHKLKPGEERDTYFMLDIKPELMFKSVRKGNKSVHRVDVDERTEYGWDVFYNINKDSTDDEILAELDIIFRALIDPGKENKNQFFYISARNIAKSVALEGIKKGRSFYQILDYMLSKSMDALVKEVLERAESRPELLKVKKGLVAYASKEGEAFQGIELAFREAMEIFSKDSVRFFLEGNPRKSSPLDLEKKISVAFTVHSTKLDEYTTLMKLIVAQVLHHCEARPEGRHKICLLLDEFGRLSASGSGIGKGVQSLIAVARSKMVMPILALQSNAQLVSALGKEDAESLIEMVGALAILSCASESTAKLFCNLAGEYDEKKISTNYGGDKGDTYGRSYERRKILEPSDLTTLEETNEIVLFLDGKYYRCDVAKARYFNNPKLLEISKKCLKSHGIDS